MDALRLVKNILWGILIISLCSMISTAMPRQQTTDACFNCHSTQEDKPSALFREDIHHKRGISCAGCHGGDPTKDDMDLAMNKNAGFIGIPEGDEISRHCALCHSDSLKMKRFGSNLQTGQLELLQSSIHQRMETSGKGRIVQCTTCHNAHGIVSVKTRTSPVYPLNVIATCAKCHANPSYMRNYNPSLPIDQVSKYKTSVHGIKNSHGDAKTAECASCHGNHDIRSAKDVKSKIYAMNVPSTCAHCHSDDVYMKEYRIPVDQFEQYSKSVHGIALLQKHDVSAPACNNCHGNHGATPPGIQSISQVCGTCHVINADLFSSSPHKKAFDDRKLPECETCHGKHNIEIATSQLLGVTSDAVCSRCHQKNANDSGYSVANEMRLRIDSLETSISLAQSLLKDAEQKGMEVSDAEYKLRDANQARLQSRTQLHSFDEYKFDKIVNAGLDVSRATEEAGRQAIHEYYFRRWGLGISTLIITILVIALFRYIRRLENENLQ